MVTSSFKNDAGINSPGFRPDYTTYRSRFAPQYKINQNFHGYDLAKLGRVGLGLGAFGGALGVFALFFFAEIPKVRTDIMQKIPIIGDRFKKEIPPDENPF